MTSVGIAKEQMEGFYKFALMGQKPTEHWGKLFLENFDNCLKGWLELKEPVKQTPSPVVNATPSVSAESHPEIRAIEPEQQPATHPTKEEYPWPNSQIPADGFFMFRDELSAREYYISGMCQACQDSVFGAGDE